MYPSYLLFALDSPFSHPILQTLLDAGHPPAALILPNPDRHAPPTTRLPSSPAPFPLLSPAPTLSQTASQHTLPILTLGNLRHPEALAALRAFRPDLFLTACFPRLFPPELLALPRLGSLNLHPSLLPAYRGPEPLFWQFYFGETRTGVTLHWMDEKADTGDIVAQAEVPFPDGITLAQAETLTALAGGDLVRQAWRQPEQLPRISQEMLETDIRTLRLRGASAQRATYYPKPVASDFVVPTTWEARRAFNFLRAVGAWEGGEIAEEGSGRRLRVREVVGFADGSGSAMPSGLSGEEMKVQFDDGVLFIRMQGQMSS